MLQYLCVRNLEFACSYVYLWSSVHSLNCLFVGMTSDTVCMVMGGVVCLNLEKL